MSENMLYIIMAAVVAVCGLIGYMSSSLITAAWDNSTKKMASVSAGVAVGALIAGFLYMYKDSILSM